MAGRRKYNSGCAVAHALDLIGERWALLVVRDLVLGPKRFTDLLAGLPGASADVLTQRLRELTQAGVVASPTTQPTGRLLGVRADTLGSRAGAGPAGIGPVGQPVANDALRRPAGNRLADAVPAGAL